MSETTVVDIATVVNEDDAMWGVFANTPQSYIDKLDTKISDSFKQEFSDLVQVREVLARLQANGYDISKVEIRDDGPSYSFPPFRYLAYLRANGPKLYTLAGTVAGNGVDTPILQSAGYFINNTRLIAKGQFNSQPQGVEFGDKVGVAFFDNNPGRPALVWTV
jgi:hypothetical protein